MSIGASLPRDSRSPPRVWILLGHKQGDNGQILAIEAALGLDCVRKHLQVHEPFVFGKPKVAPTLYHIDREKSDRLEAPWPDLVITSGRSPANVALWIRQQSGGRTRLVLVGKPSSSVEDYDLLVASSEILLPPFPNVETILLPLMQIDEGAIAGAHKEWAGRFAALPGPLTGILVGGPTNPFVFNRTVTMHLVDLARNILKAGGTPYFSTSRRTPPGVVDRLRKLLPEGAPLFHWTPDASDNPYPGLLAHADGFIVTGDSISMMVEVVRLGKPLGILPLPCSWFGSLDQLRRSLARRLFDRQGDKTGDRSRRALARLAYRAHLIRQTRDYPGFHDLLIDQGLAVRAGERLAAPTGRIPDDLSRVVARIRELVDA